VFVLWLLLVMVNERELCGVETGRYTFYTLIFKGSFPIYLEGLEVCKIIILFGSLHTLLVRGHELNHQGFSC